MCVVRAQSKPEDRLNLLTDSLTDAILCVTLSLETTRMHHKLEMLHMCEHIAHSQPGNLSNWVIIRGRMQIQPVLQLNTGVLFALLQSLGRTPDCRDKL